MTKYKHLIIFDIETGGLSPENSPITEIAMFCIDMSDLEVIDTYESGIIAEYNKSKTYTDSAAKTSGITKQMIKEGKDSKEVVSEITTFLNKYKGCIFGGHNCEDFDLPFLDIFMQEHGVDISGIVNLDFVFDTLKFSHLIYYNIPKYNLTAVCRENEIKIKNAHRAANDAKANVDLAIKIINNMRGNNNGQINVKDYRLREKFVF